MESQTVACMYSESGTVPPRALQEWWTDIEDWARKLGMPISDVEGSVVAAKANATSRDEYEQIEDRTRLSRALELGTARAVSVQSMPSRQAYRMADWRFMGHYGEDFGTGATFMVGIDSSSLRTEATCSALEFVDEIMHRSSRYIAGDNGFAVVMSRFSMPAGYALGIAGELSEELVYDCTAWRRFAGKECASSIRNVFGYNILNSKHLDIDVGGQRLEDWIKASDGRGRIEPLEGGLFLWTFQEGDDQEAFLHWDYAPVVAVREELKRHRIFPWQRLPGVSSGAKEPKQG